MTFKRYTAATVIAFGTLIGSAAQVQAAPRGAVAAYEGKTIRMTQDWSGAQTCVVHSRARVQCYATAEQADRALGYSRATDPLVQSTSTRSLAAASAIPACANGWVCLWEHDQGGGRRLIFRDDIYQDLDTYNFADTVSSWRNNQTSSDWAFMKDDDPGGPDNEFPISLSGKSYSSNVGRTWNDRADWIEG